MKKLTFTILLSLSFCNFFTQNLALHWARDFGAPAGSNYANSVCSDAAGNSYITGAFSGTVDFDPGPGTFNLVSSGNSDVFVCKYDNTGSLVWAKKLGGAGIEQANAIAVDASGNVYTTGSFDGTSDFDPGAGTFNLSPIGGDDIFVSKLDNSGAFAWAAGMGGGAPEAGNAIAVDASGNVYTTGFTQGPGDYDPGPGFSILNPMGGADVILSKLNSTGNFVWAKQFGGPGSTGSGKGITVDANGDILIAGFYSNVVDFDPGPGTSNRTSLGSVDMFITKLTAAGTFSWAASMGSTWADYAFAVSTDTAGNVYYTGGFEDACDFDPGPGTFTLFTTAPNNCFISKLDVSGNFLWAKQITGNNDNFGNALAVDQNGNVFTTGYFNGTVDFDPGPANFSITSQGMDDIFIHKLDAAGNFISTWILGGTSSEIGKSIALDPNGDVFTAGYFYGLADFDPGPGTYTLSPIGTTDIYLAKLCPLPSPPTDVTQASGQNICAGESATLSASSTGNINWFSTPAGTVVLGSGTTFITPTLSTGTYTFYAESITCFPSQTRTAVGVTVTLLPAFSVSTGIALICAGQTSTLYGSGVSNFTWNPGGLTGTAVVISPSVTTQYTAIASNGPGCSNTITIYQAVDPCNGIKELSSEKSISVFPNPFSEKIKVRSNSEISEISVLNLLGEQILHLNREKLKQNEFELNLDFLKNGIYFLKIVAGNDSRNFRIVKE